MRYLILLSIVVLLYGCNQESKPITTGEPDLIEVDWYLQGFSGRNYTGEFCFDPVYDTYIESNAKFGENNSFNTRQGFFNVSLPKGKLIIDSVGYVFLSDLLCSQPDSGLVVLWEKIELNIKDNHVILSKKNQKIKVPLFNFKANNSALALKEVELIYQTKSINH